MSIKKGEGAEEGYFVILRSWSLWAFRKFADPRRSAIVFCNKRISLFLSSKALVPITSIQN